ncbi:hypothetical protein K502DRAFT_301758 [Neoconidiobolus thromboides FSU 785]|nr:hypothetical protein K502DRAFT_301758 [Neoconidiobolus thromboides FSU 785]
MVSNFQPVLYNELKLTPNSTSQFNFNLYKHHPTNLKVLFINTPGPTTLATILIPTLCTDNKGLPHTLEHLIFCGSKHYLKRGYLEALALRSLSTGTNAWTASDHTAYTFNTVGYEGLLKTLPVFLDHVINPRLSYEDFVTEVYHVDGRGKQGGVVFSEMVSREFTEEDLLDINLRRELYLDNNTYSYECGGLTPDIAKIDIESIKEYHQAYYHLQNVTILIAGQDLPKDKILNVLNHSITLKEEKAITPNIKKSLKFPLNGNKSNTKTVHFPSDDTSVGSIGYAWRGPEFSDYQQSLTLEIILLYLTDSPASPMQQHFVNLNEPIANDVGYELRLTPETSLWLTFYGVPAKGKYVHAGVYREKVLNCIKESIDKMKLEKLHEAIRRYRNNRLRSLEEDATEDLVDNIIPAIIADTFYNAPFEASLNQLCHTFDIINSLIEKDLSYWKKIGKLWLLDQSPSEVIALPSNILGQKIEMNRAKSEAEFVKNLSKKELNKIDEDLKTIIDSNKIDLTGEDFSFHPDMAKVPISKSTIHNISMNSELKLFNHVQLMQLDTQYNHLMIGLPVKRVPDDLKPYFVLLQALMFQLDIIKKDQTIIPYNEVVENTNKATVERYATLGLGNKTFSTSWLSDYFFIFSKCEIGQFDDMLKWTLTNIFDCVFTKSRLLSTAKNLLSGLEEILRDGDSMIHYICSRVIAEGKEGDTSFDMAINLFKQEEFLADLITSISDPKLGKEATNVIIQKLVKLRDIVLLSSVDGGIVQIGFSSNAFDNHSVPAQKFKSLFETYYHELANKVTSTLSNRNENLKKKDYKLDLDQSNTIDITYNPSSLPIIFRHPYKHPKDPPYPTAGIIYLGSITSSYSIAIVPCHLFSIPASTQEHEKFHEMMSVSMLSELFSRSNGHLYELIRGQGLAYHIQLSLRPWTGGLVLELSDSIDPEKALNEIWSFFERLLDANEWDKLIDPMELELAKSSVVYNSFYLLDSPSAILDSALRLGLCVS